MAKGHSIRVELQSRFLSCSAALRDSAILLRALPARIIARLAADDIGQLFLCLTMLDL